MSFKDGWSALNLEMPPRVPRTEYSVTEHWELIRAVTGIDVTPESPGETKRQASVALMKAWNFDLRWNVLISTPELEEFHTDMGHATYSAGGADYRSAGEALFAAPEAALAFDPAESLGQKDRRELIARFEEHYASAVAAYPDAVNMTGVYITLISGMIDLLGWDMLLLAAGVDAEGFGRLCERYSRWMQQYFEAMAESNVPVVMVHDDIVWTSGAFLKPSWYRQFVFPAYRRYFEPLRQAGKKILYTSDGNYTEFLEDVVAAGADGLVMEPSTDMAEFARRHGRTHVFIGNADTRILLLGTQEQIRAEVARCMAIGKECPGFFLAVGNHIPPNTPVENALCYEQAYRELGRQARRAGGG